MNFNAIRISMNYQKPSQVDSRKGIKILLSFIAIFFITLLSRELKGVISDIFMILTIYFLILSVLWFCKIHYVWKFDAPKGLSSLSLSHNVLQFYWVSGWGKDGERTIFIERKWYLPRAEIKLIEESEKDNMTRQVYLRWRKSIPEIKIDRDKHIFSD